MTSRLTMSTVVFVFFFFFNDTATTEIYTLSLHDALPIWESPRGRLRLVRAPDDLNAVIAEVPPERGTLLVFKNDPQAWHGFEPFSGPRRVIQLNWVTDASVVRREQARHRLSAFFKRLGK